MWSLRAVHIFSISSAFDFKIDSKTVNQCNAVIAGWAH